MDIINYKAAKTSPIVGSALLAGCIIKLKTHPLTIHFDHFPSEIDSDRLTEVVYEEIVCESIEQARLSRSSVPNHDEVNEGAFSHNLSVILIEGKPES